MMVIVAVPVAAPLAAASWREVVLPPVGVNAAVTPAGSPDAEYVTAPLKLLIGLNVMVALAAAL